MASDKQRAKMAAYLSASTTRKATKPLLRRKKVMNARLSEIMGKTRGH